MKKENKFISYADSDSCVVVQQGDHVNYNGDHCVITDTYYSKYGKRYALLIIHEKPFKWGNNQACAEVVWVFGSEFSICACSLFRSVEKCITDRATGKEITVQQTVIIDINENGYVFHEQNVCESCTCSYTNRGDGSYCSHCRSELDDKLSELY